ncbi:MAG: ABC transporter permease [Alphaproteobacteria bacterium]|nr:MAG: ABC transporter permease [Alphaproteobacteria bacterium]
MTAPLSARLLGGLIVIVTGLVMLVPLAVVVAASFSESAFLVFPPRGFSLRWYGEILGSEAYLSAAWTSLRIAVVVTLLAVAIGTPAAIALSRPATPWREPLAGLFLSPLVLPTLIFGIGLLMTASLFFGGPGIGGLIIGHLVICVPYVIRTVTAVLSRADPRLEEAARCMGAGLWQKYWHVILPQCRTGIAAGAFFAFNISFDDAVVALFLRAPGVETLPIRIYSQLEFSPDPGVAAVSTLMILVSVLLVLLIDRAVGLDRMA